MISPDTFLNFIHQVDGSCLIFSLEMFTSGRLKGTHCPNYSEKKIMDNAWG